MTIRLVRPTADMKKEALEYMKKYDKTIDYAYYIDKQLKKPLGQIFCDLLDKEEQFNTSGKVCTNIGYLEVLKPKNKDVKSTEKEGE